MPCPCPLLEMVVDAARAALALPGLLLCYATRLACTPMPRMREMTRPTPAELFGALNAAQSMLNL